MGLKKGDIVTVSNKLEEYMGTALILLRNDERVDIKIIGSDDVPDEGVLLGYESHNSIYAIYCDVVAKATDMIQLHISKTFSVINRRFSTRYPAFFKATISLNESTEPFEGTIRNMSLRGFMVNTHVDIEVNALVNMDIRLDNRVVRIKARVARKNGQNYGLCAVDLGYDEKLLMRSIVTQLKETNRKLSERVIKGYIGNEVDT